MIELVSMNLVDMAQLLIKGIWLWEISNWDVATYHQRLCFSSTVVAA
jgi:hypothetical protein